MAGGSVTGSAVEPAHAEKNKAASAIAGFINANQRTEMPSLAAHRRPEDLVVMAGVGAADVGAATDDPDQTVLEN